MENFNNLDWSWKTALPPAEQFNVFNKSFNENENDILYCHLNELDPNFNITPFQKQHNVLTDTINIVDPRNNNVVVEPVLDYTKQGEYLRLSRIYKLFIKKSSLTKEEHIVCLRVLKKLRAHKKLSESDKKIFDGTTKKRIEENKLFLDFLTEKMNSQPILKAEKELNEFYKSYLIDESKSILSKSNSEYTLQTALPLPWCYETQNEARFNKCCIIKQVGYIAKYKEIDFKKIKRNWNSKLNLIISDVSFDDANDYDVFLPEETLIILLGAFENIPSGWEFMVEVQTKTNQKCLKFHKPLPLRFINNTTNTFVFEQKLKEFINTSSEFDRIKISNNEFIDEQMKVEEFNAVDLNIEYMLQEVEITEHNYEPQKIKSNNIIINCELNNLENGSILNLLINSNLDFCDEKEIPSFINLSSKLEYKKEFGSEIMTKSELLKEWLRQTIIPNSTTKRYHIDVKNFDTIFKNNLTLKDIENDLWNLYNINPLKVLGSLKEFFKMIISFPSNTYLIKFDPHHKTKLMIYREESEKTETTLSTHQLYKNIMKNCNAVHNENFLPISSTVITPLHERYKIIPSCFPYWCGSDRNISNDRNLVIERDRKRKESMVKKGGKRNRSKRKRKEKPLNKPNTKAI